MSARSVTRKLRGRHRKKTSLLRTGGIIVLLLLGAAALWVALRPSPGPSVSPSGNTGTLPGDTVPDFTVPTLDGGTFSLAAQRGKPTIIFFMAYWCGTCIPEGQALARIQQEYGDKLNIIAIDIDPSSTPEALAQFKRAAGDGAFTWAFDAGQQVTQAYQVRSLDTTLILDKNGVVVYRDEYPSPYQTLKEALKKAGL